MYTSTLCISKGVPYSIHVYSRVYNISMHIYEHTTLLLFLKPFIFSCPLPDLTSHSELKLLAELLFAKTLMIKK